MANKRISFDEYCKKYFATGFILSGKRKKKPAKPLNNNQLRTQYAIHIRKLERLEKGDTDSDISKDQIIRQECVKRDRNRCRLMSLLTPPETKELLKNSIPLLLNKLDVAHVFGKGAYPKMRYIVDNVVLLNRVSHGWIDQQKSPINGKPISAEEKIKWWQRIVGKKKYSALLEISREGANVSKTNQCSDKNQ